MGSTRCGQPRCRSIVGRGLLKVFCKVGRSSASTSLPRYYVGPLNTESGASTVAMQVVLVQMAFSRQLVHMFVLRNARYTCTIACTNSGLPCYSAILLAPPLRRGPCRQFYWFHRGEPAKSRSWTCRFLVSRDTLHTALIPETHCLWAPNYIPSRVLSFAKGA